jgi:hypothetical protein
MKSQGAFVFLSQDPLFRTDSFPAFENFAVVYRKQQAVRVTDNAFKLGDNRNITAMWYAEIVCQCIYTHLTKQYNDNYNLIPCQCEAPLLNCRLLLNFLDARLNNRIRPPPQPSPLHAAGMVRIAPAQLPALLLALADKSRPLVQRAFSPVATIPSLMMRFS